MPKLFEAFDEVSAKAWKQKIQFDLKGADYNESLIWKSPEGISVKPFYNHEDLDDNLPLNYTQATNFKIAQFIYVSNAKNGNDAGLKAISEGINALHFHIASEEVNVSELILNIDPKDIAIQLSIEFLSSDYINSISKLDTAKHIAIQTDILGHLAETGNWYHNLKDDHEKFESIVEKSTAFKSVISINTSLYQNAGANMVQQLAYSFAHANEYLNHLDSKMSQPVCFNVSVGSNYFFEIAKLRALRLLWKTLAHEYDLNTDCLINVSPSKRNKTIYDYNTNMLRTTTECMSAIIGGADVVCNLPYDALYHKENEFGNRIAKNQLLILKHESYFDAVNNPADGAYYIERLTQEMAEKALDLFKDIEKNGGFLKQLKEGTIQRKIKESATKEQERFDQGLDVLLGTNLHPNPQDKMKDDLELYPFVKTKKRKTLIEPIIAKRLAEGIEKNRLTTE